MRNLKIAATDRSPEIDFDFTKHHLRLAGESYPENVAEFYGPLFQALDDYLAELRDGECRFDFELIYFNSSSAKAILTILEKLDRAAEAGAGIMINWYYDEQDDTMRELGEEFGEDLESASFNLERLPDEG